MVIIPGGNPAPLIKKLELKTFIEELDKKNKIIGGICGGSSLFAGLKEDEAEYLEELKWLKSIR